MHMASDLTPLALEEGALNWLDSLPDSVLEIHDGIIAANGASWLVGGAVRESMRGRLPKDYDIATSLTPDKVEEAFSHTIPTGKAFGTITVVIGGVNHEVTTLRSDGGYSDGRRPDNVHLTTSLALDLERRDFTINAMAVDIGSRQLFDPHCGLSDLRNHRLRAVGNANRRLSEDGLRIMRAYRFLDQGDAFVWNTDLELEIALVERRDMLSAISVERIWTEFERILDGEDASRVLKRMANDGILDIIIGGNTSEDSIRISSVKGDIQASMRMAVLLKDRDSVDVAETLKSLKVSNKFKDSVLWFHDCLGTSPLNGDDGNLRLFQYAMKDNLDDFLMVDEDWMGEDFTDLKNRLRKLDSTQARDCLVDGHWLMNRTGLEQGMRLGRLKLWIHRLQIERNISTIEEMESLLCTLQWEHGDPKFWPRPIWP